MLKEASKKGKIVIDQKANLVFSSEEDLYNHFKDHIEELESLFFKWRRESDVPEEEFVNFEDRLELTLEAPDEIWRDNDQLIDVSITVYLKVFEIPDSEDSEYYVVLTYLTDDMPSFIYLHFPSNDLELVDRFRDGELVYSRALANAPLGSLEGDALNEEDEFATGLYEAMMVLRSPADIPEEEFREYADFREEAVEQADEIWRRDDSMGNVLVTFIKDYSDETHKALYYVAVTLEDAPSNSHVLLFSFPTNDVNLVERYKQGENLQAEEVVQEASH